LLQKANFVRVFSHMERAGPAAQKFRLCRRANHWFLFARPALAKRDASRSSRNVARDAMDALAQLTNATNADGEGVWS
jgi:hypothetical protein